MNKLKKYIKPKKSVPKKQLGGLLSGITGGIAGSLYGQGLPNDNYNYANTGHRSTSYDGLQYIPQADEPNLMPQMLDAYNTKFKLKNLYDPTKHKFDMGDLEKDLRLRGYDKERLRMRIADAQSKMMLYGEAHKNDPEKLAQWDMQVAKLKNEMMGGMQDAFNLRKDDDVKEQKIINDNKVGQIYSATDGQLMFKKINNKTGRFEPVVESEVDYNDEEHSYVPIRAGEVTALKETMSWDKFGRNLNSDLITGEEATKMAEERYKDIGYALTKTPNYINSASQSPAKQFGDHILVTTTWGQQTKEQKDNMAQLAETTKELLNQLPKDIEKGWKRDFTDFLYRGDNLMEKKITGEKEIKDANGKVVGKQPTYEYTGKKLNKEQIAGAFSNYISRKLEAINNKKQISETKTETTQGVNNNVINNASPKYIAWQNAKRDAEKKGRINNVQMSAQGKTEKVNLAKRYNATFGKKHPLPTWLPKVGSTFYAIHPTPEQKKQAGKTISQQNLGTIFSFDDGVILADGKRAKNLDYQDAYTGKTHSIPLSKIYNSGSLDQNTMSLGWIPTDGEGNVLANIDMEKVKKIQQIEDLDEQQKQMKKAFGENTQMEMMVSANVIMKDGQFMPNAVPLQSNEYTNFNESLGKDNLYKVPMFIPYAGHAGSDSNSIDEGKRATEKTDVIDATGTSYNKQGGKLMQYGGTLDDLIENRPKLNITTLTLEDLY